MAEPIKVAVTGAAGNIAYSILFRLASGEVFGKDQPVHLKLLEIPSAMGALEGVCMELSDCAFSTLHDVDATDDPEVAFNGVHRALLVGSRPRGPGMERADLIKVNGPIFVGQGKALDKADASCRVVVVGNPCNTNCMIAMNNSELPDDRFSALTRLDNNRLQSLLARKAGTTVAEVRRSTIWGNHSANQYPDFENVTINGRPAPEVITDQVWLRDELVPTVQNRGAVIIKKRGLSSAASAANGVINHLRDFSRVTPEGDWFNAAICSKGEYGVDEGLIFGYPLRRSEQGAISVVSDLPFSNWAKAKFDISLEELRQERDVVKDLLR